MITTDEIMRDAREKEASDIHITEGMPMRYRIHGTLQESRLQAEDGETRALLCGMLDEGQLAALEGGADIDFAVTSSDGQRQRVNIFRQQGKLAATIRLLNGRIPTAEELQLPRIVTELAKEPRGLILVTGPTGSGKSTTLAAMVEHINRTRSAHIITIEDPVEYVYECRQALIHQREVGRDVAGFAPALRSALREDPDIILVGEMRDFETISAALTAAETGHLVLSTLHTTGAAQTIDRIIDACPGERENQVRAQLVGVLKGIDAVSDSARGRMFADGGDGDSARHGRGAESDAGRKDLSASEHHADCGRRYAHAQYGSAASDTAWVYQP